MTRQPNQHVPTTAQRKDVALMIGFGLTHRQVAEVIGVTPVTLRKRYEQEIMNGKSKMISDVAKSLYRRALDPKDRGGVTAAIFILKAQAGWSETMNHTHNLPPGTEDEKYARLKELIGKLQSDPDGAANDDRAGGVPGADGVEPSEGREG